MAWPCPGYRGLWDKYVWRCGERYTGPEVEGWCRALWGESEKRSHRRPSAIISLFRDSCLPAGFYDGGSLTDENFDLPDLVDDLLRCKVFPDHLYPLSNPQTNNIIPGQVEEEAWLARNTAVPDRSSGSPHLPAYQTGEIDLTPKN